MEIKKYEQSEEFDRNEAIYVLSTIDELPLDQIARNFDLAVEEIKNILEVHKKYETAVIASYL